MKKLFMFLAVAGLATFGVSCSSSDDSGNGGDGGGEKTLSLSADKKEIKEGESVTFTVKVGDKAESGAELYIGADKISNPHTFDTKGEYKVVAKKEGFKDSAAVTIKVKGKDDVDPDPSLTLVLDKEGTILVGDTVSFTVINEKNIPVNDAQIFINNTAINGYSYKIEEEGTFTAYAKKGDVESNEISFEAQKPIEVPVGGFISINDNVKVAGNATVTVEVDEEGKPIVYNLNGTPITVWEFIIEDDAKGNISHAVYGLSLVNGNYGFPGDSGVSYSLLTSSTFKFDGTTIDLATDFKSFEGIAIPAFSHPNFDGEANHLEYMSLFGLTNDRAFLTSFNGEFDFNLIVPETNSIIKNVSYNEFKSSRKVGSLNNVKEAKFKAFFTSVAN